MIWLYLLPTLIWGSTWLVITFQLGIVDPVLSVLYRFILASSIALAFCYFKKIQLNWSKQDHLFFAIQGFFNFSLNYICTYTAESMVTSSMVAVAFTILPYLNSFGLWFMYKEKISRQSLIGMSFGAAGIVFIFFDELKNFSFQSSSVIGILIALLATSFASVGNLVSVRNSRKNIPTLASVSWAMFYGAVGTLLIVFILGKEFSWDYRNQYWMSLLYLTGPGTVISFFLYFTLVKKVGAGNAAYTSIMIPIIALILSAAFEGLAWSIKIWIGIALCVIGNLIILKSPKRTTP